jgi:hypothetical protein
MLTAGIGATVRVPQNVPFYFQLNEGEKYVRSKHAFH